MTDYFFKTEQQRDTEALRRAEVAFQRSSTGRPTDCSEAGWGKLHAVPVRRLTAAEEAERDQREAEAMQRAADYALINWMEDTPRKLRVMAHQSRGRWLGFREDQGHARCFPYMRPLSLSDYEARDAELEADYRHWWEDGWTPPEPVAAYIAWLRMEGHEKLARELESRQEGATTKEVRHGTELRLQERPLQACGETKPRGARGDRRPRRRGQD